MDYIMIENYISVKLGDINAYVFSVKVGDILPLYYVAVRGRDNVEGAVQRVLNKRRIGAIKNFVLDGNMFFNSFILNWVDENYSIQKKENTLLIPRAPAGAQVIDGQHRLEGIKQAVEEKEEIENQSIIVVLVENLSTSDAARIFLNINTEQKPVPTSLVYDLFGEIKSRDYYIVRANDIANKLHIEPESAYYQCVKLPGAASGKGKIDISTIISILKQNIDNGGVFSQYNLNDYESQYKVISNYLNTLKFFYEQEGAWLKTTNPFMTNSGCFAALQFLCKELIPKCAEKKSFEQKTFQDLIPLNKIGLMSRDELKNKQGKEQRNIIYDYLRSALLKDVPQENEYKF